MSVLEDIKKSISQMPEEELIKLHSTIRTNRLYRKPAGVVSGEKKAKNVKKLGISKEELEKMIKEMEE